MRTRQTAADVVLKTANAINPFTSSPAAPLRSFALFDSLGPSLMPRPRLIKAWPPGCRCSPPTSLVLPLTVRFDPLSLPLPRCRSA